MVGLLWRHLLLSTVRNHIPGELRGPHRVLRIEPRSALCKTSALSAHYLSGFMILIFFIENKISVSMFWKQYDEYCFHDERFSICSFLFLFSKMRFSSTMWCHRLWNLMLQAQTISVAWKNCVVWSLLKMYFSLPLIL